MRALTITPGHSDSARLDELPEPPAGEGSVLVATLAVGICGTDAELVAGRFGRAPSGRDRLVLGHECLGRVLAAPPTCGLVPGNLVAGIVRRPDADPCPACAAGEWDMCRDGRFTEHGIVGRDGFCREWFRSDAAFLVKVDPRLAGLGVLLEPASVVAKAWEQIDHMIARAAWRPRRALVAGAGPIGLLAALLGTQRGYNVVVLDRIIGGPKPQLARELGARYRTDSFAEAARGAEIVLECTGAAELVVGAIEAAAGGATACLLGACHGAGSVPFDIDRFSSGLIGGNGVLLGSVNSNRRHYDAAAAALLRADRDWLERLITRRVPLEHWREALHREPGDVKSVIELAPV